mmetsp:Transcript_12424/g.26439  ORF Transcript_12424/g.26439 Transcript_12424/m.26439 type:complete len:142 (+) Transcript_12424:552-977(+)
MVGWSNADYWGNAWSRPYMQQEKLQTIWSDTIMGIQDAIRNLAQEYPVGKEWCDQHLPELAKNTEVNSASIAWDPRALHRLCAQVTRDGDDADDNLVAFAEKAVEAELQFLLSHCMGLAGYSPLICRKDVQYRMVQISSFR